jgi:hypothetical protein
VTGVAERLRRPATPILLAAMLVSGVLIVALGSRLSFLLDDWTYILERRSFDLDSFLRPANEHLAAAPVALWKLLIAAFGIDSTLPYSLVSTGLFLVSAWLFFVWMRRRLGEWPALLATLPLLFLGAAFDDLLWFSASFPFLGGVACGLGMLLALDRQDRLGDRLACASLAGVVLFSSLWAAFLVGAAVDIVLRRQERDWRGRAFVILLPLGIYVAWWLGWGHSAESPFTLHNLATTPRFAFDSFAAAIAALFGLATPVEGATAPAGLEWGRPLAVLLGAVFLWRLYKLDRVPRSLWVVLAIVLAYWLLGGLAVKPGRAAWVSRYQYSGVVLILLVAAEMLRGVRLDRRLLVPALVVVAASIASNGLFLHLAYESYRHTGEIERADLAALEITRSSVPQDLVLSEDIADTGYVSIEAGPYLSARDAYGSPAYSQAQLSSAPDEARIPADKVMAAALGLHAEAEPNRPPQRECRSVPTSEMAPVILNLSAHTLLRPRADAAVSVALRRFAESFPVELGTVPTGSWTMITVPADHSSRQWQAQLSGSGVVEVCGERQRDA